MLYMAQPAFPTFAPTFPIFASRWDELAQPEQRATPSSIPSGIQAALCDIACSRWRIRIDLAQRTGGLATRGPPDRRPSRRGKGASREMLRWRGSAPVTLCAVRAPGYFPRTPLFLG